VRTLCYYLKRRMRKNNRTNNRPLGFQGYYVEVREGEDAVRAYRKIKRWIKEDKFIDQIRDNNTFKKPSEIKREKQKERRKVLRKLRRERDSNILMGRSNRR
jgi:ribosomal protein S21